MPSRRPRDSARGSPRARAAPPRAPTPGAFELIREVTRDRSTPYEGERCEEITVTDGCFSKTFYETDYGNSDGWRKSGVEDVRIDGGELVVRQAEGGREERFALPTRAWLAAQTELRPPAFRWRTLDRGIEAMGGLSIRSLDLRDAWLTAAGFAALASLPALEHLVVESLPPGASAHVARIATLRRLELPASVGDADIAALAGARLEHLRIAAAEQFLPPCKVSDAAIPSLLRMSTLRVLDVRGCTGFTDAGRSSLRALGGIEVLLPRS